MIRFSNSMEQSVTSTVRELHIIAQAQLKEESEDVTESLNSYLSNKEL